MIRQVPFFKPLIDNAEEEAVLRILRSGWLTTGSETLEFEKEFAHFVGSTYAFAVNSATTGLLLAYDACGVSSGDAIITSPYTFASTALSAIHLGAKVLYADINHDDYNISVKAVENLLNTTSEKVKVIVPIHIAGNVCKMKELTELAHRKGIAIVEDAAHAFPAKTKNGFAGTLGTAGVYSFYATKTITTAEGGMICTNDESVANRIQAVRMHGIDRSVWNRYTDTKASWQYDVVEAGWKTNLPDILSAIGRVQLQKANKMYEMRKEISEKYNKAFKGEESLILPPDSDGNAWHLYMLRIVPETLKVNRDEIVARLKEKGLGMSMHFIPHFNFTYFKKNYPKFTEKNFPNAKRQFETSMSLPFWPGMSDDDVAYVIETVLNTIKEAKR